MASIPQSQANGGVPAPDESFANHGYGSVAASKTDLSAPGTGVADFAPETAADQEVQTTNNDASALNRSASGASTAVAKDSAFSRSNTLKKKASMSRKTSLKRSSSRKSLQAGSVKGVAAGDGTQDRDYNSAFYTPIPTHSAPTEILAARFTGMIFCSS